jgi:hypothetical protein
MERQTGRPTQLITRKFAKELQLNFMKYRASIIAKYIKKEDANAIWFSVEELENYIRYIKSKGEKTGYDVNGIRIYFGVYPEEKKYAEKAGLMTVFLQATGKKIRTAPKEGEVKPLALMMSSGEGDISSIEPMNYGSIGRPPSLEY